MSSWLSKALGTGRSRGSWHDIERYTDPSTGITYETSGYRRKKRFGGSRKKRQRSAIAAKGPGGSGWNLFAGGAGKKKVGGYKEGAAPEQTYREIRNVAGGKDKWAVTDWLKKVKSSQSERWKPGKTFDLDDKASLENWIENLGGGAMSPEGKLDEGWFTSKASALRQGAKGVDINKLIRKKGDIVGYAGEKTGQDLGEFMSIAQGLADSLLPAGYAKHSPEARGDFLSKIISGEGGGVTGLLDTMQGRLKDYRKRQADASKELRRAGAKETAKTYSDIEKAKGGFYKTGRTSGIIEDLLSDLGAKGKKARDAYAQTESDLWGQEVLDPLYQVQDEMLG